jgi:short-subunit dehydrogenase
LISRLQERVARSAIIMVGSNLGRITATGSLIYSSVTRFLSMFARGLNYEAKNIDVISYEPGEI